MKKKVSIFLICVIAVTAFSGCSKDTKTYNLTADQVAKAIIQQQKTPSVTELSDKQANSRYAFPSGDVSGFTVYVAEDGSYADEIAVIKLSSADKSGDIESTLKQRVDAINENFKDYQPKECDKINKAIVYTKGNFALLAVSDSAQSIKDNFIKTLDNSAAKGK